MLYFYDETVQKYNIPSDERCFLPLIHRTSKRFDSSRGGIYPFLQHILRPATYILETIYVERTALFYEVKEKSQGSPD